MSDPASRAAVDYALARRATLADVHHGRATHQDVCDAHPYLLRAARHHGEPSDVPCPICRTAATLTRVTYVFGAGLGESSGRACASRDFGALSDAYGEITAYVVEVCQECSWNHLLSSTVYGVAAPTVTRRRRAAQT